MYIFRYNVDEIVVKSNGAHIALLCHRFGIIRNNIFVPTLCMLFVYILRAYIII